MLEKNFMKKLDEVIRAGENAISLKTFFQGIKRTEINKSESSRMINSIKLLEEDAQNIQEDLKSLEARAEQVKLLADHISDTRKFTKSGKTIKKQDPNNSTFYREDYDLNQATHAHEIVTDILYTDAESNDGYEPIILVQNREATKRIRENIDTDQFQTAEFITDGLVTHVRNQRDLSKHEILSLANDVIWLVSKTIHIASEQFKEYLTENDKDFDTATIEDYKKLEGFFNTSLIDDFRTEGSKHYRLISEFIEEDSINNELEEDENE